MKILLLIICIIAAIGLTICSIALGWNLRIKKELEQEKLIDADKLKAEIERLKQDNETSDDKEYAQYEIDVACRYAMACEEILSFITSLQQEQPEVDLEKEIAQTYRDGSVADTSNMDHIDYENIARHFYELGLKARKV